MIFKCVCFLFLNQRTILWLLQKQSHKVKFESQVMESMKWHVWQILGDCVTLVGPTRPTRCCLELNERPVDLSCRAKINGFFGEGEGAYRIVFKETKQKNPIKTQLEGAESLKG